MRVRFTPGAAKDLDEIHAFIQGRNPSAASAVIRAIREAARNLAEQPLSGVQTGDPSVRMRVVRKYHYKIFYGVGSQIEILHVRHPSRAPDWR